MEFIAPADVKRRFGESRDDVLAEHFAAAKRPGHACDSHATFTQVHQHQHTTLAQLVP